MPVRRRSTSSVRPLAAGLLAACAATAVIVPVGPAAAQSGLTLGEPDPPATLDLGAERPEPTAPATAPAAPTQAPTQAARSAAPAAAPGAALEGENVTRTTQGDWEVACAPNGECAMAQIGTDAEGTPVLEMVVRKLPEPLTIGDRTAIAVLDIVTPLGVVLTDGLGLSIDDAARESAPFQICTEQGCLVREPIDATLVERFKKGSNVKVEVVAAAKGDVTTDLSLRGFTAAFDGL